MDGSYYHAVKMVGLLLALLSKGFHQWVVLVVCILYQVLC